MTYQLILWNVQLVVKIIDRNSIKIEVQVLIMIILFKLTGIIDIGHSGQSMLSE